MAAASAALRSGDRHAFLILLSEGSRGNLTVEDLDLSGPGALKLAAAMGNATIAYQSSTSIAYEIVIDGTTETIYTVREDGVWKLDGL